MELCQTIPKQLASSGMSMGGSNGVAYVYPGSLTFLFRSQPHIYFFYTQGIKNQPRVFLVYAVASTRGSWQRRHTWGDRSKEPESGPAMLGESFVLCFCFDKTTWSHGIHSHCDSICGRPLWDFCAVMLRARSCIPRWLRG